MAERRKKQHHKTSSPLEAVLSKYKDRTKDDERQVAGADWEVFQSLSVEDSRLIGGEEDTTHLVKGLDFELLRKQQAQPIFPSEQKPTIPAAPMPNLFSVLFAAPHPHNARHKEWPVQEIPFFLSSKYVFTADSDRPVVVFGESSTQQRRPRVPHNPELVEAISECLKRKKKIKKIEDDFDIFDLTVESLPSVAPEPLESKELFTLESSKETTTIWDIQTALLRNKRPPQEEEDSFGTFGMDLAQFEEETGEKKKPKKTDKKMLQEIMKRVKNK